MNVIRYGFFGEDDAQRLFLHHYLTAVTAHSARHFEFDQEFARRFRATNKKQVDDLFDEACAIGRSQYRQNCFFVGRDLDDFDPAAFRQKQQQLQERLARRGVAAVLLVPVQCIEHWLWYLKWQKENTGQTKNINLETRPRIEAKLAVYNARQCSTKHSNPIVEQLAAGLDVAWLASRSASFLAFHTQVEAYLATL